MDTLKSKFLGLEGKSIDDLSNEKRIEMAKAYCSAEPAELEKAFILFDPTKDRESPEWLHLLGCIYRKDQFLYADDKAGILLLEQAILRGGYNHYSLLEVSRSYAHGFWGLDVNLDKAVKYALYMNRDASNQLYKTHISLLALGAHILNESDLSINTLNDIAAFIEEVPQSKYCPCAKCQNGLNSMKAVLPHIIQPNHYTNKAFEIYGSLYSQDISIDEAYSKASNYGINHHVQNILNVIRHYAHEYRKNETDYWDSLAIYWETRMKGLDPHLILQNTFSYGPNYNSIGSNALPVAGEFYAQFLGGENDLNLISSGNGLIKNITGKSNGTIVFNYDETPNALIFEHDEDILLILSFCYDEHIFPSIDVPSAYSIGINSIREKNTDPSWLIHTDIGRTLYTTDVLAGELSWSIEQFDISLKQNFLTDRFSALRNKITSCHGRFPDDVSLTPVVNINPKKANLSKPKKSFYGNEAAFSIDLNGLTVGIDGGFVNQGTTIKDREWHYRNSSEFTHTRKTNILTDHYNDIAMIFPVFERLRQLMQLSYGLKELRKTGFMLSERKMKKLLSLKGNLEQKSKSIGTTEYALYLPIETKPRP